MNEQTELCAVVPVTPYDVAALTTEAVRRRLEHNRMNYEELDDGTP